MKGIVPWLGGKGRLAKHILPLFPKHTCYVEPFTGAGALFFMKEPSKAEVLNDVNLDLVNLYRVLQNHLEEFFAQFKWALVSRKMFEWLNDTPPETLTDIQRAARFYYMQRLSFGAKLEGRSFGYSTTGKPHLNLLRLEEDLSQAHLRLSRVNIEHLDWQSCIKKYDRVHTLFYCDPPYWGTEGYGVKFGFDQYEAMAELARTIKGKMIISVNDIKEMRKVFKDFKIKSVPIKYTVGQVHGKAAERKELIIRSW
ncbi:MAG: DNA adenine methylase [Deltaproteobacteria bacterium]|nr:DNA adenine methylase [Deltaproteobacteria bacterium]